MYKVEERLIYYFGELLQKNIEVKFGLRHKFSKSTLKMLCLAEMILPRIGIRLGNVIVRC